MADDYQHKRDVILLQETLQREELAAILKAIEHAISIERSATINTDSVAPLQALKSDNITNNINIITSIHAKARGKQKLRHTSYYTQIPKRDICEQIPASKIHNRSLSRQPLSVYFHLAACTGGSSDAESDPCSMAITTRSLGLSQHYSGYNDWRVNDNFLDWHGAEDKQGLHLGQPPYGSPSVWTSNVNTSPGYQSLNTFGEAYWMLDFDLDCSLTNGGWFVIKGWLSGEAGEFSGLEEDVTQQVCSGSAGGPPPFPSSGHMAKCGHINIFHYDRGDCTINKFP
ncbi:hypothetical protein O3P69_016448 [Scylla paramamosain]|uniref:Fibrinogen C-terminal domain-containing protein n=1 Tax=Scylla paramamosain TaxID=85552 RepID=A0AAW0TGB0_SCYPA